MSTNTYVALATQTLGSAASTVTFTSIPQGYTDLVLVFQATAASANMNFDIRVGNGTVDSGSNYSDTYLLGGSGGAQSARASNQDRLRVGNSAFIQSSGGVFTATTHFMNYSNTTTYKTTLSRDGNVNQSVVESSVGLWRSTAAINIITLGDFGGATMAAGTTVSLYGIAAQPAVTAAKATGGTITFAADGYTYHSFTSSGTFTPSVALTCDYLVVAGGGGGGNFSTGAGAGGGGAGGYRTTVGLTGGNGAAETQLALTATGYTVTVGAGGSAGSQSAGSQGSNSVFGSITATGGGFGDRGYNNSTTTVGGTGGSGGGSGSNAGGTRTGGSISSPTQGFAGGAGQNQNASLYSGGGGGGAGQAGESPAGGTGGYGGNGIANSAFANATASGASTYYAGGGGGAPSGAAGLGGGAGGPGGGPAVAPAANLGAGGGGGYGSNAAASGSSGIVIVRYLS